MAEKFDLSVELEKSIQSAKPEDRIEILIVAFKSSVIQRIGDLMVQVGSAGIEPDMLMVTRRELIKDFRDAKIGEAQRSEEQYEEMFDETIEGLLNYASHVHEGEDSAKFANQVLDVNADAYVNEGGLFVPGHLTSSL